MSYIYTHGNDGLNEATEAAVLNARYISHNLADTYDKPYASDCMHEAIFSHKHQSKKGVVTLDIAKRLIDYGFHPPTVYFPLVVEGAMLIEPTESVGRADLDAFIEAMKDIDAEAKSDADLVKNAPHSTRIGRWTKRRPHGNRSCAGDPTWKPMRRQRDLRHSRNSLLIAK